MLQVSASYADTLYPWSFAERCPTSLDATSDSINKSSQLLNRATWPEHGRRNTTAWEHRSSSGPRHMDPLFISSTPHLPFERSDSIDPAMNEKRPCHHTQRTHVFILPLLPIAPSLPGTLDWLIQLQGNSGWLRARWNPLGGMTRFVGLGRLQYL